MAAFAIDVKTMKQLKIKDTNITIILFVGPGM